MIPRTYAEFYQHSRIPVLAVFAVFLTWELRPSGSVLPLNLSAAEIWMALLLILLALDGVIWKSEIFLLDPASALICRLVAIYAAWLLVPAGSALLRGDRIVLERLRDMGPGLLVLFLLVRAKGLTEVRWFVRAWMAALFVAAILAVTQKLTGAPYLFQANKVAFAKLTLDQMSAVVNPALGFFRHPNSQGMLMIVPAIFTFGHVVYFRRFRAVNLIAFALFAVCVYLTQSRGALYWCGAGIGIVLCLRILRLDAKWALLGVLVAWVLLVVLINWAGGAESGTMAGRLRHWRVVVEYVVNNLDSLAIGSDTQRLALNILISTGMAYAYSGAHNSVLDQVAIFGVPALVISFLFVCALLTLVVRSRSVDGYTTVLTVALLCLLSESVFEPFYEGNVLFSQVTIVAGIVILSLRGSEGSERVQVGHRAFADLGVRVAAKPG